MDRAYPANPAPRILVGAAVFCALLPIGVSFFLSSFAEALWENDTLRLVVAAAYYLCTSAFGVIAFQRVGGRSLQIDREGLRYRVARGFLRPASGERLAFRDVQTFGLLMGSLEMQSGGRSFSLRAYQVDEAGFRFVEARLLEAGAKRVQAR
ncbi:MAG: hypothetical protein AAGE52_35070 [Myxococcota bacterium]